MRIIEKTLYKFDELSDDAKEKAREWYRSSDNDRDFSYVIDDAVTIGAMLGIDINPTNKGYGKRPAIYFSGFHSQGDGACFEGSYSYKNGALKAIQAYAPKDRELHAIAKQLQDLQRQHFYSLTAKMNHQGHYYHSWCMRVEVNYSLDDSRSLPENELTDLMRLFADWVYDKLQAEDEWFRSDECVDESILANEYEFNELGGTQ